MKNFTVNILRGKNKVGENLIEVTNGNVKILLDCGMALNSTKETKEIENKVVNTEYDAIIITHCHADHCALLKRSLLAKQIYMGFSTKRILDCRGLINEENKSKIIEFESEKIFCIGDIECIAFLCDHSAYDSYMIELRFNGENILYSGDFRSNGRKSFKSLLNKLPQKVNLLISEATNPVDKNLTERDLKEKAVKLFAKFDKVFIIQSSLNIDRLVTFYKASKITHKIFIMSQSMSNVALQLENIPNPLTFNDCYFYIKKKVSEEKYLKAKSFYKNKLLSRNQIATKKFVMQISSDMLNYLNEMNKIDELKNSILIYSMWKGYKQEMIEFLEGVKKLGIKVVDLHVSGHADIDAIKKIIEKTNPDKVEFVHTENFTKGKLYGKQD